MIGAEDYSAHSGHASAQVEPCNVSRTVRNPKKLRLSVLNRALDTLTGLVVYLS